MKPQIALTTNITAAAITASTDLPRAPVLPPPCCGARNSPPARSIQASAGGIFHKSGDSNDRTL